MKSGFSFEGNNDHGVHISNEVEMADEDNHDQ